VGSALGEWCRAHAACGASPQVLVGIDTRESGPWIAGQIAGGLDRSGVRVRFAGVITTPGVAYLTKEDDFIAGVMISASHNPYQDNGIKVFGHNGYKLPDAEEERLEESILRLGASGTPPRPLPLHEEPVLAERYLTHLERAVPGSLAGRKVVVDCGNGAASTLGPAVLRRLGAEVVAIGCSPDGRNINLNCGALHVAGLQKKVVERGADAGFAFDGDADRCIAVSATGRIVDGDAMILLVARYLRSLGRLPGDTVVTTVMSNFGFQKALEADGIRLVRAAVGDKYVLEDMLRLGAAVGGEQSGHVIFLDKATTGDGLLTALRVLEVVQATGRNLDQLTEGLESYPQKLVNVRVKERKPLDELAGVRRAITEVEQALGPDGRVLVRFSGTEPLARVMVEGPSIESVNAYAQRIAEAIHFELGG